MRYKLGLICKEWEKNMDDILKNYLDDLMRPIPCGVEKIRMYKDEQRWISSDSKMSMPSGKGNMTEEKKMVDVHAFSLAKYPVTKGLFEIVNEHTLGDRNMDSTPMVNVSWYDAIMFCNAISEHRKFDACYTIDNNNNSVLCDWGANGYRLPTDVEWQYACKAGTSAYRYGAIADIAWYNENSEGHLHKVGKKEPNNWGLYDMLGNVWEWCWDLYDEEKYGSYRIFRGGSWCEEKRGCGATCRRRSHPTFRIEDLGFRIARSLKSDD